MCSESGSQKLHCTHLLNTFECCFSIRPSRHLSLTVEGSMLHKFGRSQMFSYFHTLSVWISSLLQLYAQLEMCWSIIPDFRNASLIESICGVTSKQQDCFDCCQFLWLLLASSSFQVSGDKFLFRTASAPVLCKQTFQNTTINAQQDGIILKRELHRFSTSRPGTSLIVVLFSKVCATSNNSLFFLLSLIPFKSSRRSPTLIYSFSIASFTARCIM